MVTAATAFPNGADPNDPNLVKVAIALDGRAIYFSRSPIPFRRDRASIANAPFHLHLGIYGYRRDFLLRFTKWPQTPCELNEKLEQLRALEHGQPSYVLKSERAAHGVDTLEQYFAFVERYNKRRDENRRHEH